MNWKRLFVFFLFVWAGVNFFQAVFTEVISDESYYYLYGKNLAWGYYDHPPMVGLIIAVSDFFFGGNLSVRFVTVILQLFTLILIWKIIDDKLPNVRKVVLFFVVAASLVMFQVYGFITTPDAPLLFFTTLFLFLYRKFLRADTWLRTLLLSVAMAGMIYSKYHALLIIGLLLLSNGRLLLRRKIWAAGLLTLLLLAPHFYWQTVNDFPSFNYHLSDRSSSFKWQYFWEYLPNQLAVFNPFTFGALVYVMIKYRANDVFERGLYFLIIGFIVFFAATSFRGHVEPHWTVICSVPMIILLYRRSLENRKLRRYVRTWIGASLILIGIARVLLITGLLPENLDFSGKKEKNAALESVAKDLPVVFTGSFQGASNYHFFTGKESFVLSAIDSRRTQFDLWEKELNFQGKSAFIYGEKEGKSKAYEVNGRSITGYLTTNFQSVNRLKIKYILSKKEIFSGDTLQIPFEIHNPTRQAVDFNHPEFPVTWRAAYLINGRKGKIEYAECNLPVPVSTLQAGQTQKGTLTTLVPDLQSAEYQFTITLVNSLCAARNSDYVSLKIAEK